MVKRWFVTWVSVCLLIAFVAVLTTGCANWSNHTTVLGVEAAWSPESMIPSGRAGLIDHDNNGISNESENMIAFVWKKYDNLNLWCLSGNAETISYTGPVDSELAKAAAEYIKKQSAKSTPSQASPAAPVLPGSPSVVSVPSVAPK